MIKMIVSMLGISGTGKTALMSGLHRTLTNPERNHSFEIQPYSPDKVSETAGIMVEIGKWNTIAFEQNNEDFAPGTELTTVWHFDLMNRSLSSGTDLVAPFQWIDYRGGAITEATRGDLTSLDTESILNIIFQSHAIILLADAEKLYYYRDDVIKARNHAGITELETVLGAYQARGNYKRKNLVYCIALTKADGVGQEWQVDNYQKLVDFGRRVFQQTVTIGKSENWIGGITPISAVGKDRAQVEIKREGDFRTPPQIENVIIDTPRPLYAENPLFFCLGNILDQMTKNQERNRANVGSEIENQINKNQILSLIMHYITGEEKPGDALRRLREQEDKIIGKIDEYKKYVEPLLSIAGKSVRRV